MDFCAVLVGMKKKFCPCRHFLWNSNSYSQPSNVSHHGGMNADHADCSTSYSSWFWCFLSLNFLYYCLIADKRQTCVLVALIVIMIVVIILFVALWGLQKRCRQKCRIDFQFSGVCRRKAIAHITLYSLTLAIIFYTLPFTFPLVLTRRIYLTIRNLKLVIISFVLMTLMFDSRVIL